MKRARAVFVFKQGRLVPWGPPHRGAGRYGKHPFRNNNLQRQPNGARRFLRPASSRAGAAVDIESPVSAGARSDGRDLLSGVLCNVFNPKAPIYFLSLFTVFISPDLPLATLCLYGAWIMVLQFLWFAAVTLFFTHAAVRTRFLAVGHWLDRIFGVVMVALGLQVLKSAAD